LLDQDSPDFKAKLLAELLKLKNFKKTITQKDIKTAILEPKNQILSDMLG